MQPLTVSLEIDYVLSEPRVHSDHEAYFFMKKGAILTAHVTHYIFPGVKEFIQLLRKYQFKIAFFTSGEDERMDEFAPNSLTWALGKEEYEKIKETVKAYSRKDLIRNEIGYRKKDLTKFSGEENLPFTVHIDDDEDWILLSQMKNCLYSPRNTISVFKRECWKKKQFKLSEDRLGLLPCKMKNPNFTYY